MQDCFLWRIHVWGCRSWYDLEGALRPETQRHSSFSFPERVFCWCRSLVAAIHICFSLEIIMWSLFIVLFVRSFFQSLIIRSSVKYTLPSSILLWLMSIRLLQTYRLSSSISNPTTTTRLHSIGFLKLTWRSSYRPCLWFGFRERFLKIFLWAEKDI